MVMKSEMTMRHRPQRRRIGGTGWAGAAAFGNLFRLIAAAGAMAALWPGVALAAEPAAMGARSAVAEAAAVRERSAVAETATVAEPAAMGEPAAMAERSVVAGPAAAGAPGAARWAAETAAGAFFEEPVRDCVTERFAIAAPGFRCWASPPTAALSAGLPGPASVATGIEAEVPAAALTWRVLAGASEGGEPAHGVTEGFGLAAPCFSCRPKLPAADLSASGPGPASVGAGFAVEAPTAALARRGLAGASVETTEPPPIGLAEGGTTPPPAPPRVFGLFSSTLSPTLPAGDPALTLLAARGATAGAPAPVPSQQVSAAPPATLPTAVPASAAPMAPDGTADAAGGSAPTAGQAESVGQGPQREAHGSPGTSAASVPPSPAVPAAAAPALVASALPAPGLAPVAPALVAPASVASAGSAASPSPSASTPAMPASALPPATPPPPDLDPESLARSYQRTGSAPTVEIGGHGSGTVTLVAFGHGRPVLRCAPLRACAVELEPGELVLATSLGDAERWLVQSAAAGPGARTPLLVVKPTACDLSTNLVIATDRRIYEMALDSPPCHGADGGEGGYNPHLPYTGLVRFYYPDELVRRWRDEERMARDMEAERAAGRVPLAPSARLARLNFDYAWDRGRKLPWAPAQVFDDGEHTYLVLAPTALLADLPILMAVDGDGSLALVSYHLEGQTLVADRVLEHAVLMVGPPGRGRGREQQRLDITNRGFNRRSAAGDGR
jgi:P-type conjugative transfer protein TrbG